MIPYTRFMQWNKLIILPLYVYFLFPVLICGIEVKDYLLLRYLSLTKLWDIWDESDEGY